MSTDQHAADTAGHADPVAHHATDDHAPTSDVLGPIDPFAWGAGILGVAIAVLIAYAFSIATSAGI